MRRYPIKIDVLAPDDGGGLLALVPDGEIVGDFIYDRLIYEMRSNVWREQGRARMQSLPVADTQSR